MDEMLDRVGPTKKAPAKALSDSDRELEELLMKSLKPHK
jgi:hypothetical protein